VPKTREDAAAAIAIAREERVPVLPRGGGTSQCGQTVNDGIVIDFSKHLNHIVSLDVENRTCVVEPGIVLDDLNRQLRKHGLWFPVAVSTASRATIGGMVGNNSCGVHSVMSGKTDDNIEELEIVTYDGIRMKVSEKGAVSVYGMGRFPVTLYKEQWAKLLDLADEIRAFIKTHDKDLKSKPQ